MTEILNFEIKKIEQQSNEEHCHIHTSAKGDFFCLTCLEFTCKYCFVNDHKNHEAKVPSEIINNLLTQIAKSVINIENISPKNNDIIQNLNKNQQMISNLNEQIMNKNQIINNYFIKELKQYFDKKRSKDDSKHELLLEKSNYVIKQIQENIQNNEKLIENQSNENILDQIIKLDIDLNLNKTNSVMEIISSIDNFNKNEKEAQILNEYGSITNIIKKFELEVKSAVELKKSHLLFTIQRFYKYYYPLTDTVFFKKSSLCFSSSKTILLSAISICSLFKNPTELKISIEVFSMKRKSNEDFDLTSINKEEFALHNSKTNTIPLNCLFFSKPIEIQEKEKYLICVENLTLDNYVSIYTGNAIDVNKFFKTQEIKCNNLDIALTFSRAKDMYSDFDEIQSGIISDLVYSAI